jgi:hypothetical protein
MAAISSPSNLAGASYRIAVCSGRGREGSIARLRVTAPSVLNLMFRTLLEPPSVGDELSVCGADIAR